MGGKVVKFRVLIGAAVLLGVIAAAEYAVKSYYYPKKTEKESTGTGWLFTGEQPEGGMPVEVETQIWKYQYRFPKFRKNQDNMTGNILIDGETVANLGGSFEDDDTYLINQNPTGFVIIEIGLEFFCAGFSLCETKLQIPAADPSAKVLLVYPAETEEQAKAIFTEVTDNLGADVWKLCGSSEVWTWKRE